MNRILFVLCFFILGTSPACVANSHPLPDVNQIATPTLHPFFAQFNTTATPSPMVSPTPLPTPIPISPVPTLAEAQLVTQTIFGDAFNLNWWYLDTEDVEANLASTERVYQGRYAIALTPLEAFTPMYFVVRETAKEVYYQDQVVSISFWLNSGDEPLSLEDLAFTIVGSNDYPYWVEEDQSAYLDGEFPFSETRLYFLGLNQSIPPNTWVEIEVVLDNLVYDPLYTYITGFYLKNDEGFRNTIYLDDIQIVMLPPASDSEPAP